MTEPEPQKTDPPEPKEKDGDTGSDDIAVVRREAAAHRVKAREAEADRDKLAERLQAAHKTEIKRLAGEHLADGADLFRDDAVELPGLLNDEGDVDPDKVGIAAAEVVERQPHWKKRPTTAGGSADGNRGAAPKDEAPSFGEALKGA